MVSHNGEGSAEVFQRPADCDPGKLRGHLPIEIAEIVCEVGGSPQHFIAALACGLDEDLVFLWDLGVCQIVTENRQGRKGRGEGCPEKVGKGGDHLFPPLQGEGVFGAFGEGKLQEVQPPFQGGKDQAGAASHRGRLQFLTGRLLRLLAQGYQKVGREQGFQAVSHGEGGIGGKGKGVSPAQLQLLVTYHDRETGHLI